MRKLLLFCCVLPSGLLFAQNWALINPDYKYNYSNDGTDTISNQIFVTHVDTLGVDSFRYAMNRVGIACMDCTQGLTSTCYFGSNNAVRAEQRQFMGWSLARTGDQWSMEGADTLLIHPFNGLGSSWVGPGAITGSITNVEETTLFGSVDSLKWIGYSNGDTLIIARDHGIVLFHTSGLEDPNYQLIGRTGLFIEGKQFPNALGIFNYQPNDILQYDFTQDYTNGYDLFFTTGTAKYRVLSRMDLADSTIYSMHLIGVSQTQCYTPQEWTPCGTTHQQGEGQVYLVVQHDHFDAGNMFTTQWNTELFPGCVGRQEQSSFDSKTLLDVRLDDAQRYVFEQWHETEHYHLICPTEQDTNVFMTDMNTVFESTYVEGIGLTYENYYYFESGDSRSLSAYSINGSQFGSITPDDILLSVNDAEMVAHRIFPNPVNDHLNLSSVTPGTVCTILNTTGQVLLTQSTSSPTERIDVSSLVPGFYILNMAGTGPHRFVIAR